MDKIDNVNFGAFVAQLRKEKGMTQKDLAQKLYVSDKAVSKWERGLSLPDIALLTPLAQTFGVTVTELLSGQRIRANAQMDVQTVEKIVSGTLSLSTQKKQELKRVHRRRGAVCAACAVLCAAEIGMLLSCGISFAVLAQDVLWLEAMFLIFGGYFWLFAKETLPAYYDTNPISTYSDGFFRMNLAGLRFNNNNWPYILRIGRIWTLGVSVALPLVYFAVTQLFSPAMWETLRPWIVVLIILSISVPIIITAKRHA